VLSGEQYLLFGKDRYKGASKHIVTVTQTRDACLLKRELIINVHSIINLRDFYEVQHLLLGQYCRCVYDPLVNVCKISSSFLSSQVITAKIIPRGGFNIRYCILADD